MCDTSPWKLKCECASTIILTMCYNKMLTKLFIENLGSQKCGRHLFTSRPKLLTLGQILWHNAGRAFQELSHVCFGFILAILGIALDRSKWRSVISPKISIFFKFDPIWPLKYWPKVTKIAHHKVHWHVFSLTKFGDSSSYRSWDSREGQNLPPPLSRARDSQTLSSARVKQPLVDWDNDLRRTE